MVEDFVPCRTPSTRCRLCTSEDRRAFTFALLIPCGTGRKQCSIPITNERWSAINVRVGIPQDALARQWIMFTHEETFTDRQRILWDQVKPLSCVTPRKACCFAKVIMKSSVMTGYWVNRRLENVVAEYFPGDNAKPKMWKCLTILFIRCQRRERILFLLRPNDHIQMSASISSHSFRWFRREKSEQYWKPVDLELLPEGHRCLYLWNFTDLSVTLPD